MVKGVSLMASLMESPEFVIALEDWSMRGMKGSMGIVGAAAVFSARGRPSCDGEPADNEIHQSTGSVGSEWRRIGF
jgi:hypothetical protein